MYDFNCASNRLLKAGYEEYLSTLRKYLLFLTDCNLINDYLADCGDPTINIEEEVSEVHKSYGHKYFVDFGDAEREEDANIYAILKHIVENNILVERGLAMGYSSSNKYNDKIKGFNERVVMILIRHIEAYMTKIGIDMGVDESVKYNITVNNGQVNLANDNATINATLNNGVDIEKLKELISTVKQESLNLSSDEIETVNSSLEVIQDEFCQFKPRKGFIQTALNMLKSVEGSVGFLANVATLAQFVLPIIQNL